MKVSNDRVFGYWVDLSDEFFANTAEGQARRASLLQIFRTWHEAGSTERSRDQFMKEMMEELSLSRAELVFGLQLAMREQLTGGFASCTCGTD